MSSMTAWESLLGLPVDRAIERANAMGAAPVVIDTCAPRHEPAPGATRRVIRVREGADGLELTVSAFSDGDPRKE